MPKKHTIEDVFNVVTEMKTDFNQKLDDVFEIVNFIKDTAVSQDEFGQFKDEFGQFKNEFGELKKEVRSMGTRLTSVESQMVTKDYLDKKNGRTTSRYGASGPRRRYKTGNARRNIRY